MKELNWILPNAEWVSDMAKNQLREELLFEAIEREKIKLRKRIQKGGLMATKKKTTKKKTTRK